MSEKAIFKTAMRPIDADKLSQAIHDEWDEVLVWDESGETTADEFVKLVDSAPTVDAVPVVRCKDCKHYVADYNDDFLIKYCELTERVYVKDFYCGFGERKEETE